MPRTRECPKCGNEMTYQEADPDTGIVAGWDCDCGHSEPDEDDQDDLAPAVTTIDPDDLPF